MTADNSRMSQAIFAPFRSIPPRLRRRLFTGLFGLFYHLSPRQRLIAAHNLKCAFSEKDMAEIRMITKGVYRTMGIVASEFFDIPRLSKETLGEFVERWEGIERCVAASRRNGGCSCSEPISATGSCRRRYFLS